MSGQLQYSFSAFIPYFVTKDSHFTVPNWTFNNEWDIRSLCFMEGDVVVTLQDFSSYLAM